MLQLNEVDVKEKCQSRIDKIKVELLWASLALC